MPKKTVNEVLTEIINLFSDPNNVEKLEDTVKKTAIKIAGIPSESYSFKNQMLLALQGTNDARGSKAWQKIGRNPRDWGNIVTIFAPSMRKIKNKETGETEDQLIGFRTIGLYAVENTYGKPLEETEKQIFKMPELVHVAEKLNCKVRFGNTGKAWGYLAHRKGSQESEIVLGTEEQGTFFHELTHLAQLRIDGSLKNGQDPTQECIAQLGSCVLARMYGFKLDNYTFQYISHYAKTNKPDQVAKKCFEISQKVSEILNFIMKLDEESKQLPMLYTPLTA